MSKKQKRVYVETSVVSGMFDSNDHPVKTQPFWDAVKDGRIRVVLSSVLVEEIERAPPHVRDYYGQIALIAQTQIEQIVSTEESDRLAALYAAARILTKQHMTDCKHVALAAIARVDALVS